VLDELLTVRVRIIDTAAAAVTAIDMGGGGYPCWTVMCLLTVCVCYSVAAPPANINYRDTGNDNRNKRGISAIHLAASSDDVSQHRESVS